LRGWAGIKELLLPFDLPIRSFFIFLGLLMPPAAKNLFEKRFLDLQKLLFMGDNATNIVTRQGR
jgi:hypothetical protein